MDVDRDCVLLGNGGISSGVPLNLLTSSLSDVWRLRAVFERLEVDRVALSGDLSAEEGDCGYREAWMFCIRVERLGNLFPFLGCREVVMLSSRLPARMAG